MRVTIAPSAFSASADPTEPQEDRRGLGLEVKAVQPLL